MGVLDDLDKIQAAGQPAPQAGFVGNRLEAGGPFAFAQITRQKQLEAEARANEALTLQPKEGLLQAGLDQIQRPMFGVLGATKALVEGEGLAEAARAGKRGLALEERVVGADLDKAIRERVSKSPVISKLAPPGSLVGLLLGEPEVQTETVGERGSILAGLLSKDESLKQQLQGEKKARRLEGQLAFTKGFTSGLGEATRSLAFEIGLDPLTYVGLGAGPKGVKIAAGLQRSGKGLTGTQRLKRSFGVGKRLFGRKGVGGVNVAGRAVIPAPAISEFSQALRLPDAARKIKGLPLVKEIGEALVPFYRMEGLQKRGARLYLWGKEMKKRDFQEMLVDRAKQLGLTEEQSQLATNAIQYSELLVGDDPSKALEDAFTKWGGEGISLRQRREILKGHLGTDSEGARKQLKSVRQDLASAKTSNADTTILQETESELLQLIEVGGNKQQRTKWSREVKELDQQIEAHKLTFEDPEAEIRAFAEQLGQQPKEARDTIRSASFFGQEQFDTFITREQEVGLQIQRRERYVPGIYPDDIRGRFNPAAEKVSPTLLAAKSKGYNPEMNMWKLIAERGSKSIDATETAIFTGDMLQRFGRRIADKDVLRPGESIWAQRKALKDTFATTPKSDIPSWFDDRLAAAVKSNGLVELRASDIRDLSRLGKNTPVFALPEPLVSWMNTYNKRIQPENMSIVAKKLNSYMNYWRAYATMPRPAFHIRNGVDNYWRLYLDIGPQAFSPVWNSRAIKVLREGSEGTVTLSGKQYTYRQIDRLMERHGLKRHGRIGADVWNENFSDVPKALDQMFTSRTRKVAKGLNPFTSEDFFLLKAGKYFGQNIEDHAHAISFMKNLDNLGDPYLAAQRTHHFLIDYRELTPFEQAYGKGLFPFYTFARKNTPLQIEQAIKQPGKFSLIPKGKRAIESLSEEPDFAIPEYYDKNYAIRLPFTKTETDQETGKVTVKPQFLNSSLSFVEINYFSSVGDIIARASPLLKVPIELFAGKEAFSDIEGSLDEGVLRKAPDGVALFPKGVRDLLGIVKTTNTISNKVQWRIPSRYLYAAQLLNPVLPEMLKWVKQADGRGMEVDWQRVFSGALIQELDPEQQKLFNEFRRREIIRDFKKEQRVGSTIIDDSGPQVFRQDESIVENILGFLGGRG